MTISWSVGELSPFHCGRGPVFVIAQLWLGTDGAWVFDMDTDWIVTLADPAAIQARPTPIRHFALNPVL